MTNYPITSAFVGASFESKLFFGLYVELNEYIQANSLREAVILQDLLSMHVTLHYLDSTITPEELRAIELPDMAAQGAGAVQITGFNYFYDGTNEKVGYFELSGADQLAAINQQLKAGYPSSALESGFPFKSHATLFRIKDHDLFKAHKAGLENIITTFTEQIAPQELKIASNVFLVHSGFEPELQVPLYS